jgi:excisionase family DNA binding protein
MSSNIEVQRICKHCGNEFLARTTTTLYCSKKCNSAAYKAKQRDDKVGKSNSDTLRIKTKPIEELQVKEFLTVKDVSILLNCSVRTAYYYINSGKIKAVNLAQRITRVKRSEIDKLFEQPQIDKNDVPPQFEISDCYSLIEVQNKYGISESALQNLLKRNNIPKIKHGWFAYVPKTLIDKLLQ